MANTQNHTAIAISFVLVLGACSAYDDSSGDEAQDGASLGALVPEPSESSRLRTIASERVGPSTIEFLEVEQVDGLVTYMMVERTSAFARPISAILNGGPLTMLEKFQTLVPNVQPPAGLVQSHLAEVAAMGRSEAIQTIDLDSVELENYSATACSNDIFSAGYLPPDNDTDPRSHWTWGTKSSVSKNGNGASQSASLCVGGAAPDSCLWLTNNMVAGICNDSSIAFPRVYAFWQYEGYNADRSDWYDVAAQSRRVWTVPYTQIEKAFGLHATSPYSFHLRTAAAHWENGAR